MKRATLDEVLNALKDSPQYIFGSLELTVTDGRIHCACDNFGKNKGCFLAISDICEAIKPLMWEVSLFIWDGRITASVFDPDSLVK